MQRKHNAWPDCTYTSLYCRASMLFFLILLKHLLAWKYALLLLQIFFYSSLLLALWCWYSGCCKATWTRDNACIHRCVTECMAFWSYWAGWWCQWDRGQQLESAHRHAVCSSLRKGCGWKLSCMDNKNISEIQKVHFRPTEQPLKVSNKNIE